MGGACKANSMVMDAIDTISCSDGGGLAWHTMDTVIDTALDAERKVMGSVVSLANWAITNATCSVNHVNPMV